MSRRVELGLEGGGVLLLTVEDAEVAALTGALSGPGDRGWHGMRSEEGEHTVDLARVLYVRVIPGEVNGRVGFGGGA